MALNFPDTPSNGQIYLGENGIEYKYNLTNDSWTGRLKSSNVPIDPSPGDVSVDPAFGNPSGTNPGSGTLEDPFIITDSIVPTIGGSTESLQTITITNGKTGDQVLFTNNTTPYEISAKYTQPIGVIDGNGSWTGKLIYNDALGAETTANISYTGNVQVGNTTVYFRWVVQQQATPPMIVTVGSALTGQALIGTELGVTQPTVTGGILPYTYSYQWQTSDNGADFTGIPSATSNVYTLVAGNVGKYIRCASTVSDSSTIQTVSITSNTAIVNAMSIDVTLSNTSPKVSETITANAVIAGGVVPVTTTYQWKADDVNIAEATSTTYTVIEADKDKRLSCRVTTTDTSGTSVSKTSDPTDPVFSGTLPEINTVTLAEVAPDSPDRYTDQSFTVSVDMTSDNPKSDYALRGKVLGDLTVEVATSVIVSAIDTPVSSGFAPVIYTGNGTTQSITTGFSPDLVWIKCREDVRSHSLFDTVRGPLKRLVSNTTAAEETGSGLLTSFNSDGFTVGGTLDVNKNDFDFVSWCWDAGDTTVTNNEGTVPSQVRSNGNFSVCLFPSPTGATDFESFGHGLNIAPKFVITKNTADASWYCYHESLGYESFLILNTGDPAGSASWYAAPTDTVFSYGTDFSAGTGNVIAYCWAESPTQNFGTYTGNSTIKPVIECGFEPAFVLIKNTSNTGNWLVFDTARSPSNPAINPLFPNGSFAEYGEENESYAINFTSTGFDVNGNSITVNTPGDTYIYVAFGGIQDGNTLTLTDTTGLSSINVGDTVVQNSSGTPVTSAITNVSDAQLPAQVFSVCDRSSDTMTPYSGNYGQLFDGAAGTSSSGPSWSNGNSGTATLFDLSSSIPLTSLEFQMTGAADFGIKITDGAGVVHTITPFSGPGGGAYTSVPVSGISSIKKVQVDGYGNAFGMYSIKLNGSLMVDNVALVYATLLTLTNDTNLANFRVGDVVSSYTPTATISSIDCYALYDDNQTEILSPTPAQADTIGQQSYFNNDINDANKTGNKGLYLYTTNSITISYSGLTAGDSIGIVAGPAADGVDNLDQNFTVSGDVTQSGSVTFYSGNTLSGTKNTLPKQLNNLTTTGSSGSFTLVPAISSDNTNISQLYIQWIEGIISTTTITEVNEATPSVTVAGGSWSNGDTITGPTQAAASGTVKLAGAREEKRAIRTSTITNVANGTTPTYSSLGVYAGLGNEIAPLSNAYDGNYVAAGQPAFSSGVNYWGADNGIKEQYGLTIPFSDKVRIYYNTNSTTGASVRINGVTKDLIMMGGSGQNAGVLDWTSAEINSPFTAIALISANSNVGVYVSAIEIDGVVLIDDAPQSVLTLTDTTELALFTPGDVIQGGGTLNTTVTGGPWQGSQSATTVAQVISVGGNLDTNYSGSYIWSTIVFNPPLQGNEFKFYVEVGCTIRNDSNGQLATASSTGDLLVPDDGTGLLSSVSISINAGQGGVTGPYVDGVLTTNAVEVDTLNATASYGIPVAATVVSTNLSTPSITTDGGSWSGTDGTSSGDVALRETKVTGPIQTIEVAGPYLALSSSSGRWLVTESDYNTSLKLNKFVKASSLQSVASLFTVMDNSGNITDLSSEDPGYTPMVGDPTYTTTFPSIFPSGQTPDVELPPGTKYQVEVKATNTFGTDTKVSNDVMPVNSDPVNAVMHGLRFDIDRQTFLSGSLTEVGGTSWTLSFWIKRSATNVYESMMYVSGNQMLFETENDNTGFYIYNFNAAENKTQIRNFTYSFTTNKWTNIVMNQDATAVRAWADGVALTANDSTPVDGIPNPARVMLNGDAAGGSCYKSEAYYVSGQALLPTVFGQDIEGKWAPLNSPVIKAGIEAAKAFDGPGYDKSQKWSDFVTINGEIEGAFVITNGFDGKIDTQFACTAAPATLDNINLTNVTSLGGRWSGSNDAPSTITAYNGETIVGQLSGHKGQYGVVPLTTSPTTITKIQVTTTSNAGWHYIEVNGKLLVDPRNTSQVWSNGETGWVDPEKAFNGNAADAANSSSSSGTDGVYTFNAISGNLKLFVSTDKPLDGTSTYAFTLSNGATQSTSQGYDVGSGEALDFGAVSGITSITAESGGMLWMVELDGEILVDGGFGANGFYLPFDPAATGKVLPASSSSSNNDTSLNTQAAFDGSLSTASLVNRASTGTATGTYTFSPAVTGSKIRIYVAIGSTDSSNSYWAVNGNSNNLISPSQFSGWVDVGVTTLSELKMTNQWITGDNSVLLKAVEVDGEILISYNNIGVDDSGNENNFADQNFAVGNTSQVWSSMVSGPIRAGLEPANAFNGETLAPQWVPATEGTNTFTPTTPIPFTTLAIWGYVDTGATNVISVNGVDCTAKLVEGPVAGTMRRAVVSDVSGVTSPLTTLTLVSYGAALNCSITAIEVDGVLLVDANIQDTVTDTPVLAYSVLDVGANGNLVGTLPNFDLTLTWQGNAGTNYYYEANGSGAVHPGGTSFASQTDFVYNFGQQPFATVYDDSQVWSANLVSFNGFQALPAAAVNGFDGNLTTYASTVNADISSNPATMTFTPATSITVATSLRFWTFDYQQFTGAAPAYANQTFSVNGASPTNYQGASGNGRYRWVDTGFTGTLNTLTWSQLKNANKGDGGIEIAAIEIDGKILVDTGSPIVAAQANTLFQTWAEWNNVAPALSQNNPAHVALFNAINTGFTAYPTDKATFVDALKTKISSLSLTTPELEVLCAASHTLLKRYVVTVDDYNGSNYFYINTIRQATLALKKGTTYIFDQDEETNTGHPLKIYTDANKTTEYTSGVTIVGTPGSALSRTAFLVPTNAPATLYYQCSNHAGMGGQLNIS
mgnify:CR=1 FL=1